MGSKLPNCSNTKTQEWVLHKTTCKCIPKKKGSKAKNLTKKRKYELAIQEFKSKIREVNQSKKNYEKSKQEYNKSLINTKKKPKALTKKQNKLRIKIKEAEKIKAEKAKALRIKEAEKAKALRIKEAEKAKALRIKKAEKALRIKEEYNKIKLANKAKTLKLKEAEREHKKIEKERKKLEKEAEKERKNLEKEAEKERKKVKRDKKLSTHSSEKLLDIEKQLEILLKKKTQVEKHITEKKQKLRQTQKLTQSRSGEFHIIPSNTPLKDQIIGDEIQEILSQTKSELKNPEKLLSKVSTRLSQKHSFSPSINKRLTSLKNGLQNNIFGCNNENTEKLLKKKGELWNQVDTTKDNVMVRIGSKTNGEAICVPWTSEKAKKVLLDNLKNTIKFNCSNIIGPLQVRSNCWFNTMLMTFFVSDKGRKFFRHFRQLMITGKLIDGQNIPNRELRKGLFLLNITIDALNNQSGISKEIAPGALVDTNTLINRIYKSLPIKARKKYAGIKHSDQANNPLRYYNDLVTYLNSNSVVIHNLSDLDEFKNLLKGDFVWSDSKMPEIIIASIHDDEGSRKSPLTFNLKGNIYSLDSAIVRDNDKHHFCSLLTCNSKEYGFDGASFSRLSEFSWKNLINKDQDWTFAGSNDMSWNFMKGYHLLFYYRI